MNKKSEIDWLKEVTSDSTDRQVAVLMGDPEGLEHPAEAILGVYEHPPDAFDEMDKKNLEGASVLVTTFKEKMYKYQDNSS